MGPCCRLAFPGVPLAESNPSHASARVTTATRMVRKMGTRKRSVRWRLPSLVDGFRRHRWRRANSCPKRQEENAGRRRAVGSRSTRSARAVQGDEARAASNAASRRGRSSGGGGDDRGGEHPVARKVAEQREAGLEPRVRPAAGGEAVDGPGERIDPFVEGAGRVEAARASPRGHAGPPALSGAPALALAQPRFPNANRPGGDLDELVVVDERQRLLERKLHRRREQDVLVTAGGADVGELLLLERVDREIVRPAVDADHHPLRTPPCRGAPSCGPGSAG